KNPERPEPGVWPPNKSARARFLRLSGRGLSGERGSRPVCLFTLNPSAGSKLRGAEKIFGGNCWEIEPWFQRDRLRPANGVTKRRAGVYSLVFSRSRRSSRTENRQSKKARNKQMPRTDHKGSARLTRCHLAMWAEAFLK